MIVLGLTGSIGMGKTTTAAVFRDFDIPVWDADAVVHALYAPGGAAADALRAIVPNAVGPDGVDRAVLRNLIARDPDLLAKVEMAVHPLVGADRVAFLQRAAPLVVLDVPLLFETGLDASVDRIAVVSVPPATQRARVLDRGTMTEAQLDAILARQMPDADKRARADYVIDTSTHDTARAAVAAIVQELT